MERLKRMSVFAKVVEHGSFTAAARQLQMSVSSISQTVSKLEDELQVKLLNRSTRSIGLTEAGKIYYQGCRRMLHEVQDVHEQLYAFNNTPIGTLRIGCSSTMAQNVLARITADMLKKYPELTVNLVTGIPAPDLIADGLDVVIRVGSLQDSSLFSRRLGAMPMVVCAAKSYLQQAGVPEKPADLANHSWLEYSVRPDNGIRVDRPGRHFHAPHSRRTFCHQRSHDAHPLAFGRRRAGLRAPDVGDRGDQPRGRGNSLPTLSVRSPAGVCPVYRERQTAAKGASLHQLPDRVFC